MAQIRSEALAYWYLRLNGFLTIPNFVVHPDQGYNQRTDVDILGVRFPYRAELLTNPMADETPFTEITDRPYIVLAEVKRGLCMLNGPWTNPPDENMHRVLRAVGTFPTTNVPNVAQALYTNGVFDGLGHHVSLLCFGSDHSAEVARRYPQVPQKPWRQVLDFIFRRFQAYKQQKASHPQWDQDGQALYSEAAGASNASAFRDAINIL